MCELDNELLLHIKQNIQETVSHLNIIKIIVFQFQRLFKWMPKSQYRNIYGHEQNGTILKKALTGRAGAETF